MELKFNGYTFHNLFELEFYKKLILIAPNSHYVPTSNILFEDSAFYIHKKLHVQINAVSKYLLIWEKKGSNFIQHDICNNVDLALNFILNNLEKS